MSEPSGRIFSANRQPVMGIAILLILFCHNSVWFFSDTLSGINQCARVVAQVGVDIFLFCSGYGLYFSFSRRDTLWSFYKKRIMRILPAYFVTLAVWSGFALCFGEDTLDFLRRYFLLSFFTRGELTVWFVPGILLLYALFPLFFRLASSRNATLGFCVGWEVLSLWIAVARFPEEPLFYAVKAVNEVLLVRFPIFLLGVFFAAGGEKRPIQAPVWTRLLMTALLTGLALFSIDRIPGISWWWVNRLLFCPLTVCLLALFVPLLDRHRGSRIYRALSFLGSITLELYLIHERLLAYLQNYILARFGSQLGVLCVNLLCVCLSVILAWCLHRLCTPRVRRPGGADARPAAQC